MTKTTPSMVRDVSAMLVDTTTFLPIAPFGFRPGEGSKILKGGKDEFEVVWEILHVRLTQLEFWQYTVLVVVVDHWLG